MSPFVKQALHWVGSALSITGIIFVIFRMNDYSSQLDFSRFDVSTWSVVTLLALVYGLANIMLALAWWNLLAHFGTATTRLWSLKVYGLTQLAKYVPGNIMHLASRQAMGMAAGLPGWPLAKASVWELGLISITGALFGVLILPQFFSSIAVPFATAVFFVVVAITAMSLRIYISPSAGRGLGWYAAFLSISGLVFVGLLALILGNGEIEPLQTVILCGAFVVAWLIGLVTPGAPAGIGVRELVLMVLLKGLVPEADLLLAILLSRVVTVGGDLLFFLFATLLPCREASLR